MIHMKTKHKLISVLSFVSIILLFSTFTYANAADAPWVDGSMFTWATEDMVKVHSINYETDTEQLVESRSGQILTYNLTDVDNSTLTYDYEVLGIFGGSGTNSYDVQLFIAGITLANMFTVNYAWDYVNNVTVMNSFSFSFPYLILVDPNWTAVNAKINEELNGSTLLDTLADPYQPITYNFTLNDVLNDATSFSIMGKSTLAEAKQVLTTLPHRWTFEFDYSNVLKTSVWNGTHDIFYNYDIRIEQTILEYTIDGVIKYYTDNGEIQTTIDNLMSNIYYESYINLGGYIITETSPFCYLLVIPAVTCMVIFVKWKNKRKN